jgi:diguanylate cyclase (GGDEF)-like protein
MTVMGRDLRSAPEPAQESRFADWTARLAVIAVLSLPVILTIAVLNQLLPPAILRYRVAVTSLATLVMTALLLLKQRRLRQELKRTNLTLEDAALNDPLTGIRNRRYFQAMVERDVAQSLREHSSPQATPPRDLIFYMVDMDNFKAVNDLYGHDAGDRVLTQLTRRLGSTIRNSDVLVRWGGEEFLIVSRAAERKNASALAERMLQVVRKTPFRIDQTRQISLTCSVGWAAFPWLKDEPNALGYNQVINLADQALQKAKNAGKNCALGITPSDVGTNLPEGIAIDLPSS